MDTLARHMSLALLIVLAVARLLSASSTGDGHTAVAQECARLFPHSETPTAGQWAACAIAAYCAGRTKDAGVLSAVARSAADIVWPIDHAGTRPVDYLWGCKSRDIRPVAVALAAVLAASPNHFGWPHAARVTRMLIDRRQTDVLPAWTDVQSALPGATIAAAIHRADGALPAILAAASHSSLASALVFPQSAAALATAMAPFATRRAVEDAWLASMADRHVIEAALGSSSRSHWDIRATVQFLVMKEKTEALSLLARLGSDGRTSFAEEMLLAGCASYPSPGAGAALASACTAVDTLDLNASGAGSALAMLVSQIGCRLPSAMDTCAKGNGLSALAIAQMTTACQVAHPSHGAQAIHCAAQTLALYPSWPRAAIPNHCILT